MINNLLILLFSFCFNLSPYSNVTNFNRHHHHYYHVTRKRLNMIVEMLDWLIACLNVCMIDWLIALHLDLIGLLAVNTVLMNVGKWGDRRKWRKYLETLTRSVRTFCAKFSLQVKVSLCVYCLIQERFAYIFIKTKFLDSL